MSQDYFNEALKNFAADFSYGDAVRHLADKGMNVCEIMENLTFPAPKQAVRQIVWKHYLDKGIILLKEPDENATQIKSVSYVQERDRYGRTSFRRVESEIETAKGPKRKYVPCDFGKEMYKDEAAFRAKLDGLNKSDRDYILELPWPLERVWHLYDDRMKRIGATGGATGDGE